MLNKESLYCTKKMHGERFIFYIWGTVGVCCIFMQFMSNIRRKGYTYYVIKIAQFAANLKGKVYRNKKLDVKCRSEVSFIRKYRIVLTSLLTMTCFFFFFFVRMRRFLLTSDTIDISSFVYSNFCMKCHSYSK